MSQRTYQVRIAGEVPVELLQDVCDLTITVELPETVLYGPLPDQSALFGLLTHLHGLGLQVIEVRRLADPEPPGQPPP
jgi:hypothetical protein